MKRIFGNTVIFALIFLVLIGLIGLFKGQNNEAEEFDVQEFTQALNNGEIKEMTMQPANKIMRITGILEKDDKEFITQVPENTDIIASITDQATEQSVLKVKEEEQPSGFVTFLTTMVPFLIIGLFIFFMLSRAQGGGGGGRVMNFGKSKAKM